MPNLRPLACLTILIAATGCSNTATQDQRAARAQALCDRADKAVNSALTKAYARSNSILNTGMPPVERVDVARLATVLQEALKEPLKGGEAAEAREALLYYQVLEMTKAISTALETVSYSLEREAKGALQGGNPEKARAMAAYQGGYVQAVEIMDGLREDLAQLHASIIDKLRMTEKERQIRERAARASGGIHQ